jgi:hypothetical protein
MKHTAHCCIGERGERNVTIETLWQAAKALGVKVAKEE